MKRGKVFSLLFGEKAPLSKRKPLRTLMSWKHRLPRPYEDDNVADRLLCEAGLSTNSGCAWQEAGKPILTREEAWRPWT